MKKLLFQGQQTPSTQYPVTSGFRKHAGILVYILIVLLGALLTQACQRHVDPTNESGNTGKPSIDSIITKPGSSSGPDGQVGVFKTFKIIWAATDHQTIQSDAAGKPVQYTSQYLYNQETGAVQRVVYQFIYGSNGRLDRVNTVGGGYVLYKYEDKTGGPVLYTEEYAANGDPLILRAYSYSDDNRLIGINQRHADGSPPTRRTYQYDVRGNVSLVADFVMNRQFKYVLETTTSFQNYDDGEQVENLLTEFPFLPGVTFRTNNYRTKVVRYKDGREISRETYAYVYNEQGLPTKKVRHVKGSTLTASYTY